jgi:ubiquinone/menaquinone biosynthesis C-methylase UbiE
VNCDPIARVYRWCEYAAFGRELERRRTRFLGEAAHAQRALVLGDGDGRFVTQLIAHAPGMQVELVDSSQAMLDLARRRSKSPRVTCRHIDARRFVLLPAHFDLVATHFFLDCFDRQDLEALVTKIADAAAPGAVWLISEFRQPSHGWRAIWAWLWLRLLYFLFALTTGLKVRDLTNHRPLLETAGFKQEQVEEVWFGLLASELWRKR